MRIAMVGPFGFRPKKTMRARAFRLARELVLRGHTVRLFMPPFHTPEEADREWQEAGVELRYVSLAGGIPLTVRRMIQEIIAWQPDVVHGFKPKAYSGLVLEWLWRFHRNRYRLAMDMDDWEGWGGWNELEPYSTLYKHFFARQEQWGMTHCHLLTVASRALETLAWGHGAAPPNTLYLPNGWGIEVKEAAEPVARPSHGKTLLVYSRFFEFDVARLVDVIAQTYAAVPDLRVLVVGASLQADDGVRFQQLMRDKQLLEIVEDVGWVEEADLPAVLCSAEVGIYLMEDTLLNRTKCPVKLADMCVLGIPVVAEAVGQVKEYIRPNQTGYLHPSGDTAAVVASLTKLLTYPQQRQMMGDASRTYLHATFAWDQAAEKLEMAYRK
ncbi:MAG: glycosyltransferase [Candidatus Promineifilaceae bacterium]